MRIQTNQDDERRVAMVHRHIQDRTRHGTEIFDLELHYFSDQLYAEEYKSSFGLVHYSTYSLQPQACRHVGWPIFWPLLCIHNSLAISFTNSAFRYFQVSCKCKPRFAIDISILLSFLQFPSPCSSCVSSTKQTSLIRRQFFQLLFNWINPTPRRHASLKPQRQKEKFPFSMVHIRSNECVPPISIITLYAADKGISRGSKKNTRCEKMTLSTH